MRFYSRWRISSILALTHPHPIQFPARQVCGSERYPIRADYIEVSGPSVLLGGATEWTISTPGGAGGCTYPASGTWYVGAIANSPFAARIEQAGLTSNAFSYGVGGGACNIAQWHGNTLFGISQVGNTINIVSFTQNGVDAKLPYDQITYTLVQ